MTHIYPNRHDLHALGGFNLPMSTVTIIETLLMEAMAAGMLVVY